MFTALVAVVMAQPAPCQEIQLIDAYRFGVSKEAVRPLWILARNHKDRMATMVRSWNHAADVERWEQECLWRTMCWDKLDDVLYLDTTIEYKMSSLARLRELLGPEAYYAGMMPKPTPNYRPWSDRYFVANAK